MCIRHTHIYIWTYLPLNESVCSWAIIIRCLNGRKKGKRKKGGGGGEKRGVRK